MKAVNEERLMLRYLHRPPFWIKIEVEETLWVDFDVGKRPLLDFSERNGTTLSRIEFD